MLDCKSILDIMSLAWESKRETMTVHGDCINVRNSIDCDVKMANGRNVEGITTKKILASNSKSYNQIYLPNDYSLIY